MISFHRIFVPNFNSLFEALPACATTLRHLKLTSLQGEVKNSFRLLESISNLINLETLDVRSSSEFVDDAFIKNVAENCKQLTTLIIGGNKKKF